MNRKFQELRLSQEERSAQKHQLQIYMREHAAVKSPAHFGLFIFRPALSALSLLVVLSGLGSVSYAAEISLPGDALYPIKIQITEPLRQLLKTSPETKLSWEIELTNKRLEEARKLIYDDRLDGKAEAELLASIEQTKARLQRAAGKFNDADSSELLDDMDIQLQGLIHGETSIIDSFHEQSSKSDKDHESYFGSLSSISVSPDSSDKETDQKSVIKIDNGFIEKRKAKALQQVVDVTARQGAIAAGSDVNPLLDKATESLERAAKRIQEADESFKQGDLEKSNQEYRRAQIEAEEAAYIIKKIPKIQPKQSNKQRGSSNKKK